MAVTRRAAWIAATVLGAALAAAPAAAQQGGGFGAVTLIVENDVFAGIDEQYTNGTFLRYAPPRNELPGWARWARSQVDGAVGPADWQVTYGLGQAMFTPADITLTDPPQDDRPYAGFLFATLALSADRGDRLDTAAFEIGVTGPPSLAEQTQKLVHRFVGDDPNGWGTQLGTEVAFRVLYEQHRRYGTGPQPGLGGLEFDAIPQATFALGTADTSATAALTLRAGRGLRKDYGPPRVRRSVADVRRPGGDAWYVFAAADGRAVGRNLFLEGNTFRSSRGVDPERFVTEMNVGASIEWGGAVISYTHAFRSPEFQTRSSWTQFGSVTLRLEF
jgi:lipid A 3-O-deacylase